jgi:hypothetical protein
MHLYTALHYTTHNTTLFRLTPTPAIMPKSCIICSAVASPDLQLQYCAQCQSALYCSKACQRIDWREKQHRQICKLLNVGHGDRQVRTEEHTRQQIEFKENFEETERSLREGIVHVGRFFKLFQESMFEESQATALEMRKIAKSLSKDFQCALLHHSLHFLVQFSNSEMLSWPNSPFLVFLQFVDPNLLFGNDESSVTPLHYLAELTNPFDYSTHVSQLILAKQLVEHGANVNALTSPCGHTPLHHACYSDTVTNLDFVEYLLEEGADPNAQDHLGRTPLMYTFPDAHGAFKFLLKWPTTDVNITTRSGASFLATVRSTITSFSNKVSLSDNPNMVQDQFVLQQWSEIEEMLVERGAVDTGITAFE